MKDAIEIIKKRLHLIEYDYGKYRACECNQCNLIRRIIKELENEDRKQPMTTESKTPDFGVECTCSSRAMGQHEAMCPLRSVEANNDQWSRIADGAVKEWEERIRSLELRNAELTKERDSKQDDLDVQFGQLQESRRQVADLTAKLAEVEKKNAELTAELENYRTVAEQLGATKAVSARAEQAEAKLKETSR